MHAARAKYFNLLDGAYDLIPVKWNNKCTCEIDLLPFRRISKTFLNDVSLKMFLLKIIIKKMSSNFV